MVLRVPLSPYMMLFHYLIIYLQLVSPIKSYDGGLKVLRSALVLDELDSDLFASACAVEGQIDVHQLVCDDKLVPIVYLGRGCRHHVHAVQILCSQEREHFQSDLPGSSSEFTRFLVQDSYIQTGNRERMASGAIARSPTWEIDVMLHYMEKSQVIILVPGRNDALASSLEVLLPLSDRPVPILSGGQLASEVLARYATEGLPSSAAVKDAHGRTQGQLWLDDANSAILLQRAEWAGTQLREDSGKGPGADARRKACPSIDAHTWQLLDELKDEEGGEPHGPQETSGGRTRERILCMVYTHAPRMHHAASIAKTWGRRCDGFLAFTDSSDRYPFAITLTVPLEVSPIGGADWRAEDYNNMWVKSTLIWISVGRSKLLDAYDYFLIGGDDLYVHVPHLRELLASPMVRAANDKLDPLYLGRVARQNAYLSFALGGSGYVLNRVAVARLMPWLDIPYGEIARVATNPCFVGGLLNTAMEDLMIAHCLKHAGITPWSVTGALLPSLFDSAGEGLLMGQPLFHPWNISEAFTPEHAVIQRMLESDLQSGTQCCSRKSISFQNVRTPEEMECYDMIS